MKSWFRPSRAKAIKEVEPVTDLDVIISEPVPFRFKGVIHYLKPFSLEEFLKFTNAQSRLAHTLGTSELITPDQLADQYHGVIASVCDTITLDDIKSMEQAQIAALYQLVIDLTTGQVDMGDGKKKRKKLDLYGSAQALSSPNVASDSAGHSVKP